MSIFSAANDNRASVPLHITLAAIETMEAIWQLLYGGGGSDSRLDAYRDRRAIRRMREAAYADWMRRRV